jgi:hypothetical protein
MVGWLNLIRNGEPTITDDTVTFLDRMQKLIEHHVDSLIGAARYERSDERATQRNGFCERAIERNHSYQSAASTRTSPSVRLLVLMRG